MWDAGVCVVSIWTVVRLILRFGERVQRYSDVCSTVCNVQELIDSVVAVRPRLQNAPLKVVICQARFPRLVDLPDEEVRPIQRALGDRYPLVDREIAEELMLAAEPSPEAILQRTGSKHKVFRFSDNAREWTATVGPEAISLETTNYVGMRDFLSRWYELSAAAKDALGLASIFRLGLRYVNEVPCPGSGRREDLEGWVAEELYALLGAQGPRTSDVLLSLSESRFHQPEGQICTLRHGFKPSLADGVEMDFLLDLDYYEEGNYDFDVEHQIRALASFNAGVYELFSWAFSESTRASFGPELEPDGKHD